MQAKPEAALPAATGGEAAADPTDLARTRSRSSVMAAVGWMAFAGLFAYTVLIGGGYGGINLVWLRILSLGLIAAGLGIWALLAWRRPAWRPRTAIWPALVLPLLALLIALMRSPNPRLGLDYLAWAVLLTALYLLLVRILSMPYARDRIGGLAALMSLVVGGAYIAIVVQQWLRWWDALGYLAPPMLRPAYIGLPIGGPTHVAPALVLLAAAAVAGLGVGTPARRIVLGTVVVVTGVALLLTGTRASWLAAAVGIGLVGLALVVRERGRIRGALTDQRARRAGLVLVLLAIPIAIVLAPAVLGRLDEGGDGGRGYFATTATRMFQDAPLTGIGPGNWTAQRVAYTQVGEPDVYVPNVHNLYAQTLAETGLIGVAAGVVAVVTVLWLILGGLRDASTERQRWAWVGLFVLVYIGLHGFLDSYTNIPAIYVLAAIPVALLDATAPSAIGARLKLAAATQARLRRAATGAFLVATAAALLVLVRVEGVALTHAKAVAAIERGDWAAASAAADPAARDDPAMPPYQLTRGLVAAAGGDWEAAEAAFAEAGSIDQQPWIWMDLALARLGLGRPQDEVIEAMERSLRIGDQHAELVFASGALYDRMGMEGPADAAWVSVLGAIPSLAADPTWTQALITADRFERLLEAATNEAPQNAWHVALMVGDAEQARAAADRASRPPLASLVIDAWSGDEGALETLQQDALQAPGDLELLAWAARGSAHAGEGDAADRFRSIASLYPVAASAWPGYEVRIDDPTRPPLPGQLASGHKWGQDGYRRPTPGLLADGLPGLVLVDLAASSEGSR